MVGDFNEQLYGERSGMRKIQEQNKLIDIMWKECSTDVFSTQMMGKTRIDYVLADSWVADCVIKGCYEPFK